MAYGFGGGTSQSQGYGQAAASMGAAGVSGVGGRSSKSQSGSSSKSSSASRAAGGTADRSSVSGYSGSSASKSKSSSASRAAGGTADRSSVSGYSGSSKSKSSTGTDTGRYGGATTGTTGQGFGGKTGSTYSSKTATAADTTGKTSTGYTPELGKTRMDRMKEKYGIDTSKSFTPTTNLTSLTTTATPSTFSTSNAKQSTGFRTATGFKSDAAVRSALNAADAGSTAVATRQVNERRAGLATAARAAENQSMTALGAQKNAYNAQRSTSAAAQRGLEAKSMSDYGALKGAYRAAIAGRETEGLDDPYGAIHPGVVTYDGKVHHAIGKYGVMDFNIPSWTKAALGKELSVEEFRTNPAAQDAVFDHRFGKTVAKNKGSFEAAAQEWYGGASAVGKPDRQRKGQPSVGDYSADAVGRFENAYASLKGSDNTQVAGGTSAPTTSTAANKTRAANEAASAREAGMIARDNAISAAVENGQKANDPGVQALADMARREAERTWNPNTSTTAAAKAPASTKDASVYGNKAEGPAAGQTYPEGPRSLKETLAAGTIDVLTGFTPGIGLAVSGFNAVSKLLGGRTIGEGLVDIYAGRLDNKYTPGSTPMRRGGGPTLGESGQSTRIQTPKSAATTGKTTATTSSSSSTFESKYLYDNGRPTPEQKWDWQSSKYIGVT